LKSLPEGTPRLARSRIVLGRVSIDTIPLQHEALQQILRDVHGGSTRPSRRHVM
jgi:hypothetical protein